MSPPGPQKFEFLPESLRKQSPRRQNTLLSRPINAAKTQKEAQNPRRIVCARHRCPSLISHSIFSDLGKKREGTGILRALPSISSH